MHPIFSPLALLPLTTCAEHFARPVCCSLLPWPGQIRLKLTCLRRYSSLRGTDESGDAAPLSEATADLS